MKTFLPVLALFLGVTAMAAPARKPLQFEHLPLGNVVRIISARYQIPVTIKANAKAPISGDFSRLDLRQGLGEAAAQAGLELVALGKTDKDGFLLRLPKVPTPPAPPSALVMAPVAPKVAPSATKVAVWPAASLAAAGTPAATQLGAADARRLALLKRRDALLKAESSLQTDLAGATP
jgi:hypothetical protein